MESHERGHVWEEKHLGSGSFGTVKLWHNKTTGERVAVKMCRISLDVADRRRWNEEVKRMRDLHHPNVVATRPIPPPVSQSHSADTVLCMEYCSGGDLRKILNMAANCCGLPSGTVLRVLHDVSSAVEYLHSQRIIHRDLKPENVVLQPDPSVQGQPPPDDPYHQFVYKLIDLGYAKKLDGRSMTKSFVGTQQYLAPELLEEESKYSFPADFWSLGTLAFEIMVGRRPFFPGLGLAPWYFKIHKKADTYICGYDNFGNGAGGFMDDLPQPTKLCEPLRKQLVPWLQVMLRIDPTNRGGYAKSAERQVCFKMLEGIFNMRLISVFSISRLTTLTYSLDDLNDSVLQLQQQLEKDTSIGVNQQDLLTGTGELVNLNQPLSATLSKLSRENCWLFLLPRLQFVPSVNISSLPLLATRLLSNPSSVTTNAIARLAFAQAIFVCENLSQGLQRLVQAHKVTLLHLLRLNLEMEKCQHSISAASSRSKDCAEFLLRGATIQLEYLQTINHLFPSSLAGRVKVIRKELQEQRTQVQQWSSEGFDVSDLDAKASRLQARIVDLQRGPMAAVPVEDKEMRRILRATHKLYVDIKHKEEVVADAREMQRTMRNCIDRGNQFISGFVQQWSPLLECRTEVQKFLPVLRKTLQEMSERLKQMEMSFKVQQTTPWQLLCMHLESSKTVPALHVSPQTSREEASNHVAASRDTPSPTKVKPRLLSLLDECQDAGNSEELMGESTTLLRQLSELSL